MPYLMGEGNNAPINSRDDLSNIFNNFEGIIMRIEHKNRDGMYLEILPCIDKSFPNHSAYLSVKCVGKKEPIYMAMLKSFDDGIRYAKTYNYDVPIGF